MERGGSDVTLPQCGRWTRAPLYTFLLSLALAREGGGHVNETEVSFICDRGRGASISVDESCTNMQILVNDTVIYESHDKAVNHDKFLYPILDHPSLGNFIIGGCPIIKYTCFKNDSEIWVHYKGISPNVSDSDKGWESWKIALGITGPVTGILGFLLVVGIMAYRQRCVWTKRPPSNASERDAFIDPGMAASVSANSIPSVLGE